jgi:ABC-type transport system involved in multi-copper enzyme maturation permease subunit
MVGILALAVVGGSYGLSGGTGGGSLPPLVVWPHAAYEANGSHLAVVFVSNPFGSPRADTRVTFSGDQDQVLGELRTDANGFVRFPVGNETAVYATAFAGSAQAGNVIGWWFPPPVNFTVSQNQFDFGRDGVAETFAYHVVDRGGNPAAARLLVNGTFVTGVDLRGYGRVSLPLGQSNVTVEVGGETQPYVAEVVEPPTGPLFGTPDVTLFLLAAVFLYLIVPIFAIVVTFDAVSKERVQGTLDLLLSRPVSRTGVLFGKFFGAFLAVAIPVTLVNFAGLGVITATSGTPPTGSFATAFLGYTLLLIAFYVLLQIIFSTLAKTSGTAVLFGVLVWLLFNILYNVLVFALAGLISDPEAQFSFQLYAGLGNPSSIYQQLVLLHAPSGLTLFFGGTVLSGDVLGGAALVWFVILLISALWVFERKAAT